jgi:hypothetical protein
MCAAARVLQRLRGRRLCALITLQCASRDLCARMPTGAVQRR